MFNANKMYPSQIMYGSILFFKLWSILNNWDFIQMYMNIYVCLILFLIEIGYIINNVHASPNEVYYLFLLFLFLYFESSHHHYHHDHHSPMCGQSTCFLLCPRSRCCNLFKPWPCCQVLSKDMQQMWYVVFKITVTPMKKTPYNSILGSGVFARGNKWHTIV